MLFAALARRVVRRGHLTIVDADGVRHEIGEPDQAGPVIRLHDRRLHTRLAVNPMLSLGEAYTDGTLTVASGSLYDFVAVFANNMECVHAHPAVRAPTAVQRRLRSLGQLNSKYRARANAHHHYDLSLDFYRLFLDQDLQYSCGYFTEPHDDLERAQRDKKRHIMAKLLLQPGQRVLDVGSGWGGLALDLARRGAGEVVGVSLAEEQVKFSRERARAAGLADRVRFACQDYREVKGPFDRIVSVGMFEHVGVRYYPAFFQRVRELLTEDGVAVLHSIGRMAGPGATNPWIRKYIFPGGYAPALSEVLPVVERHNLWTTDIEVLRLHYAMTLRLWRKRLAAHGRRVREQYGERFWRMWEFYLVGSELAFRRGDHMVFQLQLAKRRDAVPLTRDYLTSAGEADALLAGAAD